MPTTNAQDAGGRGAAHPRPAARTASYRGRGAETTSAPKPIMQGPSLAHAAGVAVRPELTRVVPERERQSRARR